MKTTVLIEDDLYAMLANEAKHEYGGLRKVSVALNGILARHFSRKKDLFGLTSKPFDTPWVRDKKDRL